MGATAFSPLRTFLELVLARGQNQVAAADRSPEFAKTTRKFLYIPLAKSYRQFGFGTVMEPRQKIDEKEHQGSDDLSCEAIDDQATRQGR